MRRVPALTTLALVGTLLSCDIGRGAACTIVTDGTREVFRHELAHCNGWSHDEFVESWPPSAFVHSFPGRLTIIQCGGGKRHHAQEGAIFVPGCKSALRQCRQIWAERGIDTSVGRASGNWGNVVGCQFFN